MFHNQHDVRESDDLEVAGIARKRFLLKPPTASAASIGFPLYGEHFGSVLKILTLLIALHDSVRAREFFIGRPIASYIAF